MTPDQEANAKQMYLEIEDLKSKHETVADPKKWWHFVKDFKFWIEVAKIVFKFVFKVPI